MPLAIITSIISAVSIISGTLIGSYCSWRMNKKFHKDELKEQYELIEENRRYDEKIKKKEICKNANLIRLDFSTSIFQSIRSLKNNEEGKEFLYLIPINKEYSSTVAALSHVYNLKELSYLYQYYAILEKVNRDIYNWNMGDKKAYENIKKGFALMLQKIYGENYKKLLLIDIDNVSYEDLYKNEYIKKGYKEVLTKLEEISKIN